MKAAEYEELVSRVAKKIGDGIPELRDGAIGFGKANRIEGASGFRHQIDVSVNAEAVLLIAECKRWKRKVKPEAVLAFAARFLDIKARLNNSLEVVAAIATMKGCGPGAEHLARFFGVELWAVASEQEFVCRVRDVVSIGVADSGSVTEVSKVEVVSENHPA